MPASPYRRGVAAVEAAVCLPILVLLTFAVLECCDAIFIKQGLAVSAFEGARVAILPGAKRENVEAQIRKVLLERDIQGGSFKISPANFADLPPRSHVTVEVEAPAAQNSIVGAGFFTNTILRSSTTMMVEN
jgi:hypothetical protein